MVNSGAGSQTGNPRLQALVVLLAVIGDGRSLDRSLDKVTQQLLDAKDQSLMKALVYGVLRDYYPLHELLKLLLSRPLKNKDRDLGLLIMMGLFQLQHHRVPEYAIVSETVGSVAALGKSWAKGLVNAVLRQYQRQHKELLDKICKTESARYSAPEWLIKRLQQDWPQDWQSLLQANNRQAPMVLRINMGQTNSRDYVMQLASSGIEANAVDQQPGALQLASACNVEVLPGFESGIVSVQDAAAQWAALLLDVQSGQRVLDACAAPGGKTLHILESQPDLVELVAVEIDESRASKISENLQRLSHKGAQVEIKIADICELGKWWDGKPFQRILLDAPCSGSGVIRRHPDIQLLRRVTDIDVLAKQQANLLRTLWMTLAPGGVLLYCTCSVFKVENEEQVLAFLGEMVDAEAVAIELPQARQCKVGVQILTGTQDRDGFYYAKLHKQE